MKKSILIIIIYLISNLSFGQIIDTVEGNIIYSCGEKNGLTETTNNYILTVYYDSEKLKYKINENDKMTSYRVINKAEDYIIGKHSDLGYSIYAIKRKQFYMISYFMDNYITACYGEENNEMKQNVLKMMKILKRSGSERRVIKYLIKTI